MTKYLIDLKICTGTFKSHRVANKSEALKIVEEIEKLHLAIKCFKNFLKYNLIKNFFYLNI